MTDSVPPHDESAERALLSVMMSGERAIADATEILKGDEWYLPRHKAMYDAILAVHREGGRPDPMRVADHLQKQGLLRKFGGAPWVHTVMATPGVLPNASYYAEIVAQKAVLRRLLEASTRINQLVHTGGIEVDDLLDQARASVDHATNAYRNRNGDEGIDVGDLALAALDRYASPRPPGLPTGWKDLDELLGGGLRPGQLVVIGARTGIGKSILGINLAVQAAEHGTGALFASLEMHRDEVMDRIYAQMAKVELSRLTQHRLQPDDWASVQEAAERLTEVPLRIEDTPHLSMARLRALARDRTRHPAGLGLVVADYMQLVRPADSRISREQQVAEISRSMKLLAKELHVPVVALSQLNREAEKRVDKRPIISDLRESGAIEQDADVIMLLWDDPERIGERQLNLAKQRQGRTGDVRLGWAPHYAEARSLYVV